MTIKSFLFEIKWTKVACADSQKKKNNKVACAS